MSAPDLAQTARYQEKIPRARTVRRITVITPTFEPNYTLNPALEEWYEENFRSFLRCEPDYEVTLILSDFSSNETYKSFLRRFVANIGGRAKLIEGPTRLSSYDAVNLGLAEADSELVAFVASDCRARDEKWLSYIADDFRDPEVFAVFPTVNFEGVFSAGQNQPEPIERESKEVQFPHYCDLITVVFRREYLAPFDFKIGNRFPDGGAEVALVYQAAALGKRIMLNFRCNIIHDKMLDGGRYDRTLASHWTRSSVPKQNQLRWLVYGYLPVPAPRQAVIIPWVKPLISGYESGGIYGFFRALYIRIRQSSLYDYLYNARSGRFWEEILRFRRAKRRFQLFAALPESMRIALVRALYFTD